MKPVLVPVVEGESRLRLSPGDVAIIGCALVVALMAVYSVTHTETAQSAPQNAVAAQGAMGSALLTGSDNPEENESGAQEEPELIQLRDTEIQEHGAPVAPRAAPRGARPRKR